MQAMPIPGGGVRLIFAGNNIVVEYTIAPADVDTVIKWIKEAAAAAVK